MYSKFLLTGATGFLGGVIAEKLVSAGKDVRCLVLKGDRLENHLPPGITKVYGDVCDKSSLFDFFEGAGKDTCVIHCAGIVSVASAPGKIIYDVNVRGTKNILDMCRKKNVGKLVYVSSVHAIPESSKGEAIREVRLYSPDMVAGDYAKSKAMATIEVLEAAKEGLNASVVLPSGIIGPNDYAKGNITTLLLSFLSGKLPMAVKGGYDFVDVRDVAHGVLSCCENGRKGESYILSGHYATIKEILGTVKQIAGLRMCVYYVSIKTAKLFAPMAEKMALCFRKSIHLTPYAIAVLDSNGFFDREKAFKELGYTPRPLKTTLADTLTWMRIFTS